MLINNLNKQNKLVYIYSLLLTGMVFFLVQSFNDEVIGILVLLSFIIFTMIGDYLLKRNKFIIEISNGILNKDIRFYIYDRYRKLDYFKIRANENTNENDVKESLDKFLDKNSYLIQKHEIINLLGFDAEEEKYVSKLI